MSMSLLNNPKFLSTFRVIRYSEGEYVKGEYKEGETTEFDMSGSVQPWRNLELLQEQLGRRVRKAVKIYTKAKDPLFTSKIAPSDKADRVVIEGETYEIHESLKYTNILPHHKSIAILMDSQELEEENAE